MKLEITQAQTELLIDLVQEEIIRVNDIGFIEFRSQILSSLKSLNRKLKLAKTKDAKKSTQQDDRALVKIGQI